MLLAVFIPLTFLEGVAGIMFKQLGWIVSIVIIISTLAALTLTPMLSSIMLKNNPNRGKVFNAIYTPIEKFLDWLDKIYAKMLGWCVSRKGVVLIVAMLIFGSSLLLFKFIPTEFFPTQDQARLSATVKLPIGTRMETSRAFALDFVEQVRKDYPEVLMINFSVGQPDDDNTFGMLSQNGSHIVKFNVRLTKKTERKRSLNEIADNLRADLAKYPEVNTYIVSSGGGMGGQNSVDVELYCYDLDITDKFAADLKSRMEKVPGCSEVSISREEYTPEFQVDFDREKLAEHGLNLTTAASYVRNRFNGYTASYYREDGDEYNIKVRYAPEYRESIESIENILVYNNQGVGVRVKDLGTVVERLTPPTISRKDRERMVKVSCVVAKDAVLSELVAETEKVLNDMEIPSSLMYEIGGAWEDQQESFADMIMIMVLIVILVYIVMASQFESFSYPFIIMFSIPFALTGVLIGLAVSNTPLGIMAMVGILLLIGIVVKNGIVLVDYTILCCERGQSINEAIVTAGRSRLRPILMTTLTTVLGMIPLAVDKGEGAEMWNSLGTVVSWGLSLSTLVTLVLIPILFGIFAERKEKKAAKKALKVQE